MLEQGQIPRSQLTILIIIFMLGSSILFTPGTLTAIAKQDAWIAAIVGSVFGLMLVLFYNSLVNQFEGQSFVGFSEKVLGKWLGKKVAIGLFMYSFLLSSLVVRNMGDFFTTFMMPETPIQSFHILFLLVIVMGTRLGIEVIGRSLIIVAPWLFTIVAIGMAFLIPQMELHRMEPVAENPLAILQASYVYIGSPVLELVVFLVIFPYVNRLQSVKKGLLVGTLIGSILQVLLIAYCVIILGADNTTRQTFPSHTLVRQITLGVFRFDSLFTSIIVVSSYYKAVICFYVSNILLGEILNLRDYRFLSLPLGLISIVLSIVAYPNYVYAAHFITDTWTAYSLTMAVALPLLLYVVSLIRKRARPS